MNTPYQILNVLPDTSDKAIKQAYLQQVKLNPPDRDQQKFQLIHDAYMTIKDVKSRLRYELFDISNIDFDKVIDQALKTSDNNTITAKQISTLLDVSIDDITLQNALSSAEKQ